MKLSFSNFILFLTSVSAAKAQESEYNQTSKVIVGGTEAPTGRYEYQVVYLTNSGGMCGGSLIAPDVVLSAAHCLEEGDSIPRVYINIRDITEPLQDGEEMINVEEAVLHPDYDDTTKENDVMILKLESPSTKQPVAYDNGNADTSEGDPVTVMGFGTTSSGGSSSDVLLEVEVDIVSNEKCNAQYGGSGITSNMMCAAREGKDSCQGDSGGPLIIKGSDAASDMQVGVVSFGK